MLRSILVPLDGSALAASALPYAQSIAGRTGAKLVLATVAREHVLPGGDEATAALQAIEQAEWSLDEAADAVRQRGYNAEAHTYVGEPGPALIAAARDLEVDLIAMSTHRRSGLRRWLFDGVADELVRAAEVPVLVVPADVPRRWPTGGHRRVLLPLDGWMFGEEAIEPACALTLALDASLVLTRIVEPPPLPTAWPESYWPDGSELTAAALSTAALEWEPRPEVDAAGDYLRRVSTRLGRAARDAEVVVEVGDPATTIVEVARRHDVDAIAMATHGRHGLERLLLGGTATRVLAEAHVPVLMVRPTDAHAELVAELSRPSAARAS
jgi:nucleotide-binding universal stress UspA family protein